MINKCPKCNFIGELNETLQVIQGDKVQIRGMCIKCDSYVMWVPYKESTLIKAILLKEALK